MEPTTFYVYKITYKGKRFYGYGISKNFYTRNRKHMRQFEKAGAVGKLAFVRECQNRIVASGLESTIKSCVPVGDLDIDAFRTENVTYENRERFIDIVESFDFDQVVPVEEFDNERLSQLGLHNRCLYNQQVLNILKDKENTELFLSDLLAFCTKHKITDIRTLGVFLDQLTNKDFFWTNQKEPVKCFDGAFGALSVYEVVRQERLVDQLSTWD